MELEKCPFCGGETTFERRANSYTGAMHTYYRVVCQECHASTGWHGSKWKAREAWNTRKEPRCRNCRKDDTLECPVVYIEKQQMVFVRHDPDWYCGDFEEEKTDV